MMMIRGKCPVASKRRDRTRRRSQLTVRETMDMLVIIITLAVAASSSATSLDFGERTCSSLLLFPLLSLVERRLSSSTIQTSHHGRRTITHFHAGPCISPAIEIASTNLFAGRFSPAPWPLPSSATRPRCVHPYSPVGRQCLFFSRPEPAWGIGEDWSGAYLTPAEAAGVCRQRGGDLAARVVDFAAAEAHCRRLRGGCAPSLVVRLGRCFQWSPLDGGEVELPCDRWEFTTRFICEMESVR